jgi:potassium/chloride transporter 9
MIIFAAVMISVISVALNFAYAKPQDDISCPSDVGAGPGNVTCPGDLAYKPFSVEMLKSNMYPAWTVDYTTDEEQSLRTVFAVLFNGCTGIMAGANISGDLQDASVSIPYGTIAASAFTFVVYILLFVLSAASCNRDLLLYDYS